MTEESMDVRSRIIRAATQLLATGGREAVSTRAVTAARVQAPTIYRRFGDMHGLLHVVAGDILAHYVQQKRVLDSTDDPIEDLRRGWEHQVAFGVGSAAACLLIYARAISLRAVLATAPAVLSLVGSDEGRRSRTPTACTFRNTDAMNFLTPCTFKDSAPLDLQTP